MREVRRESQDRKQCAMHPLVRIAALTVACLTAAVPALDLVSSLVYRTNQSATLRVLPSGRDRPSSAVVIFPGIGMSGALAAESLRGHVPADTVVLGVNYAERGVHLDAISQSVIAELNRLQPSHVYLYGASMGGLVADYVANKYALHRAAYDVSLILDTAPAGPHDVRWPQALLAATCYYPGGVISSWIWSLVAQRAPRVPLSGTRLSLVQQGREYGESVGSSALASQACLIRSAKPMSTGPRRFRAFYAQAAAAPEQDPFVDTKSAIRNWRAAYPGITELSIPGRNGTWHVPLIERPIDTAEVLEVVRSSGEDLRNVYRSQKHYEH